MSRIHLRGLASLSKERRREIAMSGGRAAHKKGVAHEFTKEEAALAGKKGGKTTGKDREHMSKIGKIGGSHSRSKKVV